MERGQDEKYTSTARSERRAGVTSAVCLAFILLVCFLVSGMAAAEDRPAGSGIPTVTLYVGSG